MKDCALEGLLVDYVATATVNSPQLVNSVVSLKNSYVAPLFDFTGDSPCSLEVSFFIAARFGVRLYLKEQVVVSPKVVCTSCVDYI